jgi:NagD protein
MLSPNPLWQKKGILCDMDGVLYHGNKLLPGVKEFLAWLRAHDKKFLFLTNSSDRTPEEFQAKLSHFGIEVAPDAFYTSALATAHFVASQHPAGSAYVLGDHGINAALEAVGYRITDQNPDYVIVGETRNYHFDQIEKAGRLVMAGARLIGTNLDICDPAEEGLTPAGGALMAPIEAVTRRKAYFLGKPNPLMMRQALARLGCCPEDAVMIGDRMDTDIIGGLEAGIDTILVLSGITRSEDLPLYAYRPSWVVEGVGGLLAG